MGSNESDSLCVFAHFLKRQEKKFPFHGAAAFLFIMFGFLLTITICCCWKDWVTSNPVRQPWHQGNDGFTQYAMGTGQ